MTTPLSPMNSNRHRLEQRLRHDASRYSGESHIDIADRLAGKWPSVDRTVKRGGASKAAFALSLLVLAATVIGVAVFNQPNKPVDRVATPVHPRILLERQFNRDDVAVQMASWTRPLEIEARAIASDLTNSVNAVRRRFPIPVRLTQDHDERSSSD